MVYQTLFCEKLNKIDLELGNIRFARKMLVDKC